MADMGKAFPTTNGVWSATTQYERLCIVTYNGSSYISTNSTINDVPGQSSNWQLMAVKGGKGDPAPRNQLSGAALPVNKYVDAFPDLSIKDDGTPETALQNNSPGWSFKFLPAATDGKFHQVFHDFSGVKGTAKFFFYVDKPPAKAHVVKTVTASDGINIDSLIDSADKTPYNLCGIATSNGMKLRIAVYDDAADLKQYCAPIGDGTIYNGQLLNPLDGTVKVMKRSGVWYVVGNISNYTKTNDNQNVVNLPFSSSISTFPALSDNGQYVEMVVYGSTLILQHAEAAFGTVRFSWSIPEELLQ